MLKLIAVLLALGMTADGNAPRTAAEPETLAVAADRIIMRREEGFVLERTEVTESQTVKLWRAREGAKKKETGPAAAAKPLVEIRISQLKSEEAAKSQLEKSRQLTEVSSLGSIRGLGEESHVWSESSGGFTSIRFRKANVVIFVSATSRELGERFAFHMLEAVDDRLAVSGNGLIAE